LSSFKKLFKIKKTRKNMILIKSRQITKNLN
jgi:hypothetical protein